MHGIDVGQPALCRGIDCLSLISSHSLLARSRNDELRQISDTGASVWSSVNPPPPSGAGTLGEERHGLQLSPPMLGCALINALISSFVVCFNDKHVPCGNLVTFCKYCWWFCLHLPLFSFLVLWKERYHKAWIFLTWLGCQWESREPHDTFSHRDTGSTWAEEMSSDKIPACWDVLCFVDKAIIHHYALGSKNPLLHLRHMLFMHSWLCSLLYLLL